MNAKKIFLWHSWSGLIAGIFILIVSLTGGLLAFHDEIDDVLYAPYIRSFDSSHQEKPSLDRAFKNVYQNYPGYEIRVYRLEESSSEKAFYFDVRSKKRKLKLFVHPMSGEILKEIPHRSFLSTWLLELHYALFMGKCGRLLMFFVSIALLISLISGLFIYRKRLIKAWLFKDHFQTKNPRAFWSSIHRVFGSWLFLLSILPVTTGLVLSYQKSQSAFLKNPDLPHIEKKRTLAVSIDKLQIYMTKEFRDFQPSFLRLPLKGDELAFAGRYKGDFFLWGNRSSWLYFDSHTGALKRIKKIRDQNLGQRLERINHTLHLAEYGNGWIKFLYSISGFGLGLLSLTGFYLYFFRKTSVSRPKP